jgi:hypothetical protein
VITVGGVLAALMGTPHGVGLGEVAGRPNRNTQEGSVRRTVACLTAVGSLALVSLGLVPAAAPANAPSAILLFVRSAPLHENGTALVSLVYKCKPDEFGSGGVVEVGLQQPGVFGFQRAGATCDEHPHMATVEPSPGPFKKGTASAVAQLSNITGSSSAQALAEIQIR